MDNVNVIDSTRSRGYAGGVSRIAIAVALLLGLCGMAMAQGSASGGTVTTVGTITPGDCTKFASQTVLQDAGAACGSGVAVTPVFASYTFNTNGTTVNAVNNTTGATDYTGTDAAVVFNDVTTALATVGGHLYFKIGVYPINSMIVENVDATTCNNFGGSGKALAYALAFPANSPYSSSVEWFIEGETTAIPQLEAASTSINNAGVIFNVTSTAVSSVAANSVLAGFWQRPPVNCTLTPVANPPTNEVHYKNVTLRFPTNQRGNEIGFASYFLASLEYDNVKAEFNLTQNSIATGSAPVVGSYNSIGMSSTYSGSGNYEQFTNTYVTGWNLGYDIQSELVTGNTLTAVYNNYAGEFGRSAWLIYHPILINHIIDQENAHGFIFGPNLLVGTRIDIFGLDIELGASGWYARTSPGYTETNPGYSSGIITYAAVVQGLGINPSGPLFSSGGQGFIVFSSFNNPFEAAPFQSDTMLRNTNTTTLGANWGVPSWGPGMGIQSNAAVILSSQTSGNGVYTGQAFGNNQFSKFTVNAKDSAGGVEIHVYESASVESYYAYTCGEGINRAIYKLLATVATQLAITGGSTTCVATDTMEIDAIPISGGVRINTYYNGVLDMTVADTSSPITSGNPGMAIYSPTTQFGDSITNWVGGNLPNISGPADSIYSKAMFAPTYNTTTNCSSSASPAVCGSAAAGSVLIPTGTTSSTLTVNTTAVTANSQIIFYPDDSLGTRLSTTCNSTLATLVGGSFISARTPGTSFAITFNGTIVSNGVCGSYTIIN